MRKSRYEDAFVGTWVSAQPFDSDDYLVEYTISRVGSRYQVTAKDYRDGEPMEISEVKLNRGCLQFRSVMPSTGRTGINRFTLKDSETILTEFTFTVLESLKRIPPPHSPPETSRAPRKEVVKRR